MQVPSAEAILDALSSEVVLLDARGRILSCNRAWRAFGERNGDPRGGPEWVGMDYLGVSQGPDGGDAARAGIQDLLDGRRSRFDLEYPCHGPTQRRWFEMTATRLDGDGGPWIVITHVNITDRHDVEDLRRQRWQDAQAIQAAAERARFMRGFVNELAHELNTPMTTLLLRVRSLAPALPAGEVDALAAPLDRLQRAVRGIATVRDALDISASPQAVPLGTVERALADLAPEARRRGLRAQSHVPDLDVWADPGLLHGCMAALASSAAALCPSGGSLSLDASRAGAWAEIVLQADTAGALSGSEGDLWLLSARELARRAGLSLQERAEGNRVTYVLKVPLAPRTHASRPGSGPPEAASAA